MSAEKGARRDRAEEYKKLIERLDSYDSGPHDFDAEKAERERLLAFPPMADPYDPHEGKHGA